VQEEDQRYGPQEAVQLATMCIVHCQLKIGYTSQVGTSSLAIICVYPEDWQKNNHTHFAPAN